MEAAMRLLIPALTLAAFLLLTYEAEAIEAGELFVTLGEEQEVKELPICPQRRQSDLVVAGAERTGSGQKTFASLEKRGLCGQYTGYLIFVEVVEEFWDYLSPGNRVKHVRVYLTEGEFSAGGQKYRIGGKFPAWGFISLGVKIEAVDI